jgi:hypothetical protein
MGKRISKKSNEDDPLVGPIEEHPANPYEARAALQSGVEAPIGSYLRDVADSLELLADQFDPNDDDGGWEVKARKPTGRDNQPPDQNNEWASETTIAMDCIRNGEATLVGWYIRDLGKFVRLLAEHFDPTGTTERQLTFARRKRGKPKDSSKMLRDMDIALGLLQRRGEKKDNAVREVAEAEGVSRSTAYRAGGLRWKRKGRKS